MFAHKILSVALAIFWSGVGVSRSYDPCPCIKPAVRREWRTFSTEEKAEWIRAVNVRINSRPYVGRFAEVQTQCLSKVPHDPALTPSVDPLVSLIPPVNASSSYYDGII
jgi:tyrosinase